MMVAFKSSPMKEMFEFILKGTTGYVNLKKDCNLYLILTINLDCAKKNEENVNVSHCL